MSTPQPSQKPDASGRGGGRGGGGGRKRGKGGTGGGRSVGGGRGGGAGGGAGRGGPPDGNAAAKSSSTKASEGGQPSKRPKSNKGRGGDGAGRGGDKSKQRKGGGAAATPKLTEQAKQEQARRAQEAETKRQEDARKAAAAAALEKRRKEKDVLEQKVREAADLLKVVVESTTLHRTNREIFAAEPLSKFRKDFESNKKKLKTDLKKCTAFVKKIKSGSAWSMRAADIEKDIATLNLSRYVEEVAGAVLETKPKLGDIPLILVLSAAMHQCYPDYLPSLLPPIWNVIQGKGSPPATPEIAKLRRVYVRLVTEFLLNRLIPEPKHLLACIAEVTGGKDGTYAVQDANMVVAFGKAAGFEIFGVAPQSVQAACTFIRNQSGRREEESKKEEPKTESATDDQGPILASFYLLKEGLEWIEKLNGVLKERGVSPEISDVFSMHCTGAYMTLSTSLVQTHNKLQKLEKRCEQDRLLSGNLPEAREKGLVDARKLKESLQKSVEALADVLDQSVPELKKQKDDAEQEGGVGLEVWTKDGGDENDFGPFGDEDTRAFYCDIPDLLTTIPPALLGLTPEAIELQKAANIQKYGADAETDMEEGDGITEMAFTSDEQLEAEEEGSSFVDDDGGEIEEHEGDEENKDTPHYRLMVLLEQELPECNRREQLDELAEKFCTNHGSLKNARKRLQKALFLVPSSRLDLLPYYSRIAATLDRVWLGLAAPLVMELEQQFHGQAKFKKNQNIGSRMRTARYIGELTKFEVAPPIIALRCLRRCLEDFTSSNVDVACCLLESCGRYLYRKSITSAKLTTLMDSMTRFSRAKNLDERSQSLIKAAFYSVKPPPSGPRKLAKVYPPLELYLRHLLMVRLEPASASVSFVTKQIVRFPWNEPSAQCGALVVRIMMKACRKGRYKTIHAIAAVAVGLRTQQGAGEATIRLIDAVLEELRWSMENPNFRDQQRIITYARLLGELFCVSQISVHIIFQQLYSFINLGHEISGALREASEKLDSGEAAGQNNAGELPVFNSARGVSQIIQEDEEMEETELETTEEKLLEPEQQPVAVSQYSVFDPRVPSLMDPPNSAFRIKLVCTLLEVVAKSIVTRNTLPRLKGFLTAFQRYLFTKSMLPTDVEFSLLDSFDILDSHWRRVAKGMASQRNAGAMAETEMGFPRYVTWLDAHNATVAVEESEALSELRKRAPVTTIADSTSSIGDTADSIDDDDASVSSTEEDADAASLSHSARDSRSEWIEDEMELDDEEYSQSASEGDEEDESGTEGASDEDEEEDFDEEAYMCQLEEEAFERDLRRVTMDALEKGKNASRKQVADYMPSGSQISIKKKPTDASKPGTLSDFSLALGGKSGISFQLLKKGNKGKVEAKELIVPTDTNLAMVATKQDDAAARERDMIKQRVLQYEAESADASFAGGNVYLEQEKLQVIRNRPLSMDVIDRNFGTSGGNLRGERAPADTAHAGRGIGASGGRGRPTSSGRDSQTSSGRDPPVSRGGRGRGRGRGRSNASGRSLFGS